jgi:hypothetical protein
LSVRITRGAAVAIGRAHERGAGRIATKLKLVLERIAHVLAAMIVANGEGQRDVRRDRPEATPDARPQRLQHLSARGTIDPPENAISKSLTTTPNSAPTSEIAGSRYHMSLHEEREDPDPTVSDANSALAMHNQTTP